MYELLHVVVVSFFKFAFLVGGFAVVYAVVYGCRQLLTWATKNKDEDKAYPD